MGYFWLKTEIFFSVLKRNLPTNFQRQVWLLSSRKTNIALLYYSVITRNMNPNLGLFAYYLSIGFYILVFKPRIVLDLQRLLTWFTLIGSLTNWLALSIEERILEAKTDCYGNDRLFVASFAFCVITFDYDLDLFSPSKWPSELHFCERYLCRWRKIV